jgi:hypothetical protein
MRTTLSLDDDVAKILQQEMRRSGATFKDAVNHYLRLGLMAAKQPARKRFEVHSWKMGLPRGLNYDSIPALLEALDGPQRK